MIIMLSFTFAMTEAYALRRFLMTVVGMLIVCFNWTALQDKTVCCIYKHFELNSK
jgi:hypothetical protein